LCAEWEEVASRSQYIAGPKDRKHMAIIDHSDNLHVVAWQNEKKR
jgi:hypothetical protein